MSKVAIKNCPKSIYLCICDRNDLETHEIDFKDLKEVSWAEDRPVDVTVKYVNAALVRSRKKKLLDSVNTKITALKELYSDKVAIGVEPSETRSLKFEIKLLTGILEDARRIL